MVRKTRRIRSKRVRSRKVRKVRKTRKTRKVRKSRKVRRTRRSRRSRGGSSGSSGSSRGAAEGAAAEGATAWLSGSAAGAPPEVVNDGSVPIDNPYDPEPTSEAVAKMQASAERYSVFDSAAPPATGAALGYQALAAEAAALIQPDNRRRNQRYPPPPNVARMPSGSEGHLARLDEQMISAQDSHSLEALDLARFMGALSEEEQRMNDEFVEKATPFLGRAVNKAFGGKMFEGEVASFSLPTQHREDGSGVGYFRINYLDGDMEDVTLSELRKIMKR
jgi:hypothetical protein